MEYDAVLTVPVELKLDLPIWVTVETVEDVKKIVGTFTKETLLNFVQDDYDPRHMERRDKEELSDIVMRAIENLGEDQIGEPSILGIQENEEG